MCIYLAILNFNPFSTALFCTPLHGPGVEWGLPAGLEDLVKVQNFASLCFFDHGDVRDVKTFDQSAGHAAQRYTEMNLSSTCMMVDTAP